jgi:hypothetical protein
VVAAMRSPSGGSAALLGLRLQGQGDWLLSVAMALEYETICMLADHRLAANATLWDVANIRCHCASRSSLQWRPQLTDAGDEIVLVAPIPLSVLTTETIKAYPADSEFGSGLRGMYYGR